jgi:hypothetical protein
MLNTSSFLMENLYLGLKFGYFNLTAIEGLTFNTLNIGLMGNYQIIKGIDLAGVLQWRGLTLGSGLIFQRSVIEYALTLDEVVEPITGGVSLVIPNPAAVLGFTINTFTIPLEASTSVRLLWSLNLSLGVGADLAFGKSELAFGASGDVDLTGAGASTPGHLTASGGGSAAPSIINPKITAGFGFTFGPVVLDIPVSFYIAQGGYSVGVSLGAVW